MNFLGIGPFEVAFVALLIVAFWPDRAQAAVGQVVRAISRIVQP